MSTSLKPGDKVIAHPTGYCQLGNDGLYTVKSVTEPDSDYPLIELEEHFKSHPAEEFTLLNTNVPLWQNHGRETLEHMVSTLTHMVETERRERAKRDIVGTIFGTFELSAVADAYRRVSEEDFKLIVELDMAIAEVQGFLRRMP